MPGFNRTGPTGVGPMTGGRKGFCNPATAGSMPVYRGGFGYNCGARFKTWFQKRKPPRHGARVWPRVRVPPVAGPFYPSVYPMGATSEIDMLKEQANHLKNSLESINRRIETLEKQ